MFTLKLRRDSASVWKQKNPVLEQGEPGFEVDTGKLKLGDGASRWLDLPYFIPGDHETVAGHIESETPHPVYDDGPSLVLLYQNAKV